MQFVARSLEKLYLPRELCCQMCPSSICSIHFAIVSCVSGTVAVKVWFRRSVARFTETSRVFASAISDPVFLLTRGLRFEVVLACDYHNTQERDAIRERVIPCASY